MSRIGKKPIPIPPDVTVDIANGVVSIRGPRGELRRRLTQGIMVEVKDGVILCSQSSGSKKHEALWGLTRSLLASMTEGVTKGFEIKLECEGIGYRASIDGDGTLVLSLGFSHPVMFRVVSGIKFSVDKNVITISGVDKELVGNTAAAIRAHKPPEPYKGKGIRYQGEFIRRKAGKKAVASA